MTDIERTPPATLMRAREIALLAGLNYVYTGNVHDEAGGSTYCPSCEKRVIARDWYQINSYELTDSGACKSCGTSIAGRFGKFGKPFGSRRIPVACRKKHFSEPGLGGLARGALLEPSPRCHLVRRLFRGPAADANAVGLSGREAGMIQAAFHLGYLTSLFIVGFIADHFGAKRTYILAASRRVRARGRSCCSPTASGRRSGCTPSPASARAATTRRRWRSSTTRRARAARPRHGLSHRRVERRLRALPRVAGAALTSPTGAAR